jgi:hypothetical protein
MRDLKPGGQFGQHDTQRFINSAGVVLKVNARMTPSAKILI